MPKRVVLSLATCVFSNKTTEHQQYCEANPSEECNKPEGKSVPRFSHAGCEQDAKAVSMLYVMKVAQMKWAKFSVVHDLALHSHTFTCPWCYTLQFSVTALYHRMLDCYRTGLLWLPSASPTSCTTAVVKKMNEFTQQWWLAGMWLTWMGMLSRLPAGEMGNKLGVHLKGKRPLSSIWA